MNLIENTHWNWDISYYIDLSMAIKLVCYWIQLCMACIDKWHITISKILKWVYIFVMKWVFPTHLVYISFAHLAIIIFNKNYKPIESVNSFGTIYLYAIRNTFAKKMTNSSRTVCNKWGKSFDRNDNDLNWLFIDIFVSCQICL